MDSSVERVVALNEYHSYLDICHHKGLSFTKTWMKIDVSKLDVHDLKVLTNSLKAIARTPTE